jgi:hypothetical protein
MEYMEILDMKFKRHYEDTKGNIGLWYILLGCSNFKLSESNQRFDLILKKGFKM